MEKSGYDGFIQSNEFYKITTSHQEILVLSEQSQKQAFFISLLSLWNLIYGFGNYHRFLSKFGAFLIFIFNFHRVQRFEKVHVCGNNIFLIIFNFSLNRLFLLLLVNLIDCNFFSFLFLSGLDSITKGFLIRTNECLNIFLRHIQKHFLSV